MVPPSYLLLTSISNRGTEVTICSSRRDGKGEDSGKEGRLPLSRERARAGRSSMKAQARRRSRRGRLR